MEWINSELSHKNGVFCLSFYVKLDSNRFIFCINTFQGEILTNKNINKE